MSVLFLHVFNRVFDCNLTIALCVLVCSLAPVLLCYHQVLRS